MQSFLKESLKLRKKRRKVTIFQIQLKLIISIFPISTLIISDYCFGLNERI